MAIFNGRLNRAKQCPKRSIAMGIMAEREVVLQANAGDYTRVALSNIEQEFPSDIHHTMRAPGNFPYRPRERTSVFYGSFDWHSCVEMHWLLVRLLRYASDHVPQREMRAALDKHFTAEGL